jgi:hypothetical protein
MPWGAAAGAAIGAIGSYGSAKAGAGNTFGGGMDYANKVARQPMIDTLEDINRIYGGPAVNELMQQGFDAASGLPAQLQPYLNYGNAMMGAGAGATQGLMQGAGQLMGYDPTQYNATFQGAGAVGPEWAQNTFDQIMGNVPGVVNPMLQSIAAMNARTLGEQQLPGVAGNAILSGNDAGSKWGQQNSITQRGMIDANQRAATDIYGQFGGQAMQQAGQYGIETADAYNQAMLQNMAVGNQLNFSQASDNAQNRLSALNYGTGAYGDLLDAANPYWGAMMQIQTQLPGLYTQLGEMQRNAPADWLKMKQDAIGVVGNFGTGGAAGANGATTVDYAKGIGEGALAGINVADYFKTGKTPTSK